MKVREIYFKTNSPLDELASTLKAVLNLPDKNKSVYCKDQRRFSSNKGGPYYLFEILGFTLELISNKGDAEIPERAGWDYYLIIYSEEVEVDEITVAAVANHICAIVRRSGMEAEVDSLSY